MVSDSTEASLMKDPIAVPINRVISRGIGVARYSVSDQIAKVLNVSPDAIRSAAAEIRISSSGP
jgi:hypothetical protein